MATVHEARVKYALGPAKPSKYEGKPDCSNILVEVNGEDQRIYVDVNTKDWELASAYRKGDPIRVLEDKGKFKILGAGGEMVQAVQMTTPNPTQSQEPPKTEKLDPEKAKDYALIYASIFKLLEDKMGVTIPSEVVKDAASTVFISLTGSKRY